MFWQSGKKIFGNRYVILEVIGEGGCGITYLAEKNQGKDQGQHLVIKTVKDEILKINDPMFDKRKFLQGCYDEGSRLAICRHENIVKIDNVFREGDLPCIAMEYIAGEDLGKLVNRNGRLSEVEAVGYVSQIADALIL